MAKTYCPQLIIEINRSKSKESMVNIFDKIVGSGKFSLGKAVLIGLMIAVPLFIIAILPGVIWFCIPADKRYEDGYAWLGQAAWIFPVCFLGLGFLSALGWMIYNNIRDARS